MRIPGSSERPIDGRYPKGDRAGWHGAFDRRRPVSLPGGGSDTRAVRVPGGFSVLEVSIAVAILTAAVIGLAASSASMLSPGNDPEAGFLALQLVEDRIAEVRLDPRYEDLGMLYDTTQGHLPGLPGAVRSTELTRTLARQENGKWTDYWTLAVTVSGGPLRAPVRRSVVLAAP